MLNFHHIVNLVSLIFFNEPTAGERRASHPSPGILDWPYRATNGETSGTGPSGLWINLAVEYIYVYKLDQ